MLICCLTLKKSMQGQSNQSYSNWIEDVFWGKQICVSCLHNVRFLWEIRVNLQKVKVNVEILILSVIY
jgi:hypothetical protein